VELRLWFGLKGYLPYGHLARGAGRGGWGPHAGPQDDECEMGACAGGCRTGCLPHGHWARRLRTSVMQAQRSWYMPRAAGS